MSCIGRNKKRAGRLALLAMLAALAVGGLLAGCGGSGEPRLTVFAASSLQEALGRYGSSFAGAGVRSSFTGSDALAAQISQGAAADVFVSADSRYPARLHGAGLVGKPLAFAANELVVATPAGSGVSSLADLARPGVKLVIGTPSVPVGAYTREALRRLPAAQRRRILANVRSEEPQVSSIVAKLDQGAADAGFAYVTDVRAAGGELRAVRLPASLRPQVTYAAAVVSGSGEQRLAQRYLNGLLDGAGRADLRRAGFLPPP